MNNFLPLSPSSFYTFLQCPAKLYYKYDNSINPLPIKPNPYMDLGTNFHKIVAAYYTLLKSKDIFSPDEIHNLFQIALSKKRHLIDDLKKYTYHFKRFEEFERKRLSWTEFKPLEVEQKHKNITFKGIIDIIFRDNQDQKVVVDWKTGGFKDWHYMQGYIYKNLSRADIVMFFYTLRGKTVKLTDEQLLSGETEVNRIISELESGVSDRKENAQCQSCEYSLFCKINKLQMGMEEI